MQTEEAKASIPTRSSSSVWWGKTPTRRLSRFKCKDNVFLSAPATLMQMRRNVCWTRNLKTRQRALRSTQKLHTQQKLIKSACTRWLTAMESSKNWENKPWPCWLKLWTKTKTSIDKLLKNALSKAWSRCWKKTSSCSFVKVTKTSLKAFCPSARNLMKKSYYKRQAVNTRLTWLFILNAGWPRNRVVRPVVLFWWLMAAVSRCKTLLWIAWPWPLIRSCLKFAECCSLMKTVRHKTENEQSKMREWTRGVEIWS